MRAVVIDTSRAVYCGPMAIAAVTGRSASEVLERVESLRGPLAWCAGGRRRRGVVDMNPGEVGRVVRSFGFRCTHQVVGPIAPRRWITLAGILRTGAIRYPIIVEVADHYLAVDAVSVVDTSTRGRPVAHASAPDRSSIVCGFFDVRPRTAA